MERAYTKLERGCPNGTNTPPPPPPATNSNSKLFTLISLGNNILDSWGVCVWSFMIVGVKGKQLCAKHLLSNQCIVTFAFGLQIKRAHWILHSWGESGCEVSWLCKRETIMHQKLFSVIKALWPWPLDPKIDKAHPQLMGGGGGVCMWIFIIAGVDGKRKTISRNQCIVSLTFDLCYP